jgi:hypothetical protein
MRKELLYQAISISKEWPSPNEYGHANKNAVCCSIVRRYMLLGHTTFAEQAFQDARLDAVHNIEFAETGFGLTFTIGTEVATGGANVSPEGSEVTFGLGDETAFGDAFSSLITFSVGELDFFVWNETDDSETSTWKPVDPGSTD